MIRQLAREASCYFKRNRILLDDLERHTHADRVNLHWYRLPGGTQNLGDYLSTVVVGHMLEHFGLDAEQPVSGTRHLYAVGSILAHGYQDATVWGSGLLGTGGKKTRLCLRVQKLDVRAVRGPLTQQVLRSCGHRCPDVFGDPAVLMPLFYQPAVTEKRYDVSVIIHHTHDFDWSTVPEQAHRIDILTCDYRHFIDELCASRLVISSTLHGIILAESYGVPAVLLVDDTFDLFKYRDYYCGTGRKQIVTVRSVQEGMEVCPLPLPTLAPIQQGLIRSFPTDLWK